MSQETVKIKCPCCGGEIVAHSKTGEVLSHKQESQASKRDMGDLLQEVKNRKKTVASRFEQEVEAQKNRKEVLEKLFDDSLKKVDKNDPPKNPFDL